LVPAANNSEKSQRRIVANLTVVLQAARTQNRLQFLLRQAEIFQHFAPAGALEKEKAKGKGK
jgi:hypothetical protein